MKTACTLLVVGLVVVATLALLNSDESTSPHPTSVATPDGGASTVPVTVEPGATADADSEGEAPAPPLSDAVVPAILEEGMASATAKTTEIMVQASTLMSAGVSQEVAEEIGRVLEQWHTVWSKGWFSKTPMGKALDIVFASLPDIADLVSAGEVTIKASPAQTWRTKAGLSFSGEADYEWFDMKISGLSWDIVIHVPRSVGTPALWEAYRKAWSR